MSKGRSDQFSIYLSYLLRHNPAIIHLDMDRHGWVSVAQLICHVNEDGRYTITREYLEEVVATDRKGRYRISEDGSRIKACQGHSLTWVEPELEIMAPPEYLYHGTHREALQAILESGYILRMQRHAVHMQAAVEPAWKSAKRWKGKKPVVLKIAAARLAAEQQAVFGKSENDVWCCERIPAEYIEDTLYP